MNMVHEQNMEQGTSVADGEVTEGAARNKSFGVSGNKGHEKVKAAEREGPDCRTPRGTVQTT